MPLFEIAGEALVGRETFSAPAFVIEERSGQKRRLMLSGSCLPLADQSTGWSGRQRTLVTHYPGNPEATVQVLGPAEDPSTFTFRLDRAGMGGGVATVFSPLPFSFVQDLSTPLDLVQVLDEVRLAGQELEVTWGSFVRRGVLESVTSRPRHELLIDVKLAFVWHSRGDFIPAAITGEFDFRNPAMTLLQLLTQWADLVATPARMAQDVLDELNGYVLQAEAALTAYSSILDEYIDLGTSGRDMIQNVIGLAGTVREAAQNLGAALELDPGSVSDTDGQAEVLGAAQLVVGGQDVARQMREQAELIQQEALALFGGDDVLAVELAYDGATLQQYASTYYGDPSQWVVIAEYNQLSSPRLSAGEVVVVPSLQRSR